MTDSRTDPPDQSENTGFNVISLQAEEFVLHPLLKQNGKKINEIGPDII